MKVTFISHVNKTHFHVKGFVTWPRFESEVFDMKITFISHANKTHFQVKGFVTWPRFGSEGYWNSEMAY